MLKTISSCMKEVSDCHSPRFSNGLRSSGHRHIFEVSCPPETEEISDHDLSAPNLTIRSIACPIERDTNHRARQMVLGHATGDMGVVVLDGNGLHVFLLQSPLGRKVAGMKIVGDHGRLPLQNAFKVRDGFLKKVVGSQVLQIADVLSQEGILSPSLCRQCF